MRREVEIILQRFEELKTERAMFEGQWRDISEHMRPVRDEFRHVTSGIVSAPQSDPYITDSTSFIAVDNMVAAVFGFMSNPANRWFEVKSTDEDLNEFQTVKEWLDAITTELLRSFAPARSNFYAEAPELYADTPSFGWGCMFDELIPGTGGKFFDKSFGWAEIFIDTDQFGNVDTVYRWFWMTPRQLAQRFSLEELSEKTKDKVDKLEKDKVQMLHVVYPNTDVQPQRIGLERFNFIETHIEVERKHEVRLTGREELPFQVPRWQGSRKYGYGLGRRNLPDTKTINAMDRSVLEASEFQARPSVLAPDEDVIEDLRPVPRGVSYGAITRSGKRLVEFLAPQGNLQFTGEELEQRRQNLRDAWMFSIFQTVNRSGLNPIEVLQIQEDRMRLFGPPLLRQQIEFLSPKITRRFNALNRIGQLPPPPPDLPEGLDLQIEYVSPMARAQKAQEAQSVLRFVDGVATVANLDPNAADVVEGTEAALVIGEGFGAPSRVITSPEEREARRQSRDQLAQIQQALAAGQQSSEIARNLGIQAPQGDDNAGG